jgi:hypothetical protein
VFFVRSAELHICPICDCNLFVIGSRERKGRKPTGEKIKYIIRRLRCEGCKRVHHELPDLFVPYKRYEASCIESVLAEGQNAEVAVDDSTLYRWRLWFVQFGLYWVQCLHKIAMGLEEPVEPLSIPSPSALQQIGHYVGHRLGWLSRLVRPLVHSKLWVHTRSAFMSTDP